MVGLLDAVKDRFDAQPERVLADAGGGNERDLLELEARGIDGYVAPGREGKKVTDKDAETPPATHRRVEKLATPAGRGGTRNANGCPKRPMVGSRKSLDSGDSACGA